ncbi:MAG TPA: type II secretion system F family protein [Desulfuromonadaceae bacterium]|nr:type II secretion system F family protein [Desulfuromonadaceae bacterium]
MIVTPGQLTQRADFYHQLAQLTAAGIGVTNALGQMQRHPPGRSYRVPLARVLEALANGQNLSASLRNGNWLPDFDLALIEAGERSGRLDACFKVLADYYTQRATLAKQIIGELLYPAFLIHFAALIFLIVLPYAASSFNANIAWLFAKAALTLSPLYIGVALLIFANQNRHGEQWRAFMERLSYLVPVVGSARHSLALSRLAMALEALISAGVNIIQAWELAAAASASPALSRAIASWQPHFAEGKTPSELVNVSRVFPEMFANLYHSGEMSGKLDETLRRLHTHYLQDATYKLQLIAQWIPRVIYLAVVIIIGIKVIQFWSGYFNQISNVMNGF